MPIQVICDCGRKLLARDEYSGRQTDCPDCGRTLRIGEPDETDGAAPPETERLDGSASDAGRPPALPIYAASPEISSQSIASLLLGTLAMAGCTLVTGLPAVFIGMAALRQAQRSRGRIGGQGLAIAGIITGLVGTLILPLAALGLFAIINATRQRAVEEARVVFRQQAEDLRRCSTRLERIATALNAYAREHRHYPPLATRDPAGRPLLSWRVAILPQLGRRDLYERFQLDEPWSSPRNRSLVREMPEVFNCPTRTRFGPQRGGVTCYQAASGPRTLFDGNEGVRLNDIPDGPGNTLLVVESATSIPWTSPDDQPLDPNPGVPPPRLAVRHSQVYNAVFANGRALALPQSIRAETLRALMTRNGREPISPDDF